jgi:hypothetical protein
VSGDGCSAECTVEIFYTCINEPSFCNQTIHIIFELASIEKTGCNEFTVSVVSPIFTLDQIVNNFNFVNQGVYIVNKRQNSSHIDITAQYDRDIANEPLILDFWPGQLLNITYNPAPPALFYNEEECQASEDTEVLLKSA